MDSTNRVEGGLLADDRLGLARPKKQRSLLHRYWRIVISVFNRLLGIRNPLSNNLKHHVDGHRFKLLSRNELKASFKDACCKFTATFLKVSVNNFASKRSDLIQNVKEHTKSLSETINTVVGPFVELAWKTRMRALSTTPASELFNELPFSGLSDEELRSEFRIISDGIFNELPFSYLSDEDLKSEFKIISETDFVISIYNLLLDDCSEEELVALKEELKSKNVKNEIDKKKTDEYIEMFFEKRSVISDPEHSSVFQMGMTLLLKEQLIKRVDQILGLILSKEGNEAVNEESLSPFLNKLLLPFTQNLLEFLIKKIDSRSANLNLSNKIDRCFEKVQGHVKLVAAAHRAREEFLSRVRTLNVIVSEEALTPAEQTIVNEAKAELELIEDAGGEDIWANRIFASTAAKHSYAHQVIQGMLVAEGNHQDEAEREGVKIFIESILEQFFPEVESETGIDFNKILSAMHFEKIEIVNVLSQIGKILSSLFTQEQIKNLEEGISANKKHLKRMVVKLLESRFAGFIAGKLQPCLDSLTSDGLERLAVQVLFPMLKRMMHGQLVKNALVSDLKAVAECLTQIRPEAMNALRNASVEKALEAMLCSNSWREEISRERLKERFMALREIIELEPSLPESDKDKYLRMIAGSEQSLNGTSLDEEVIQLPIISQLLQLTEVELLKFQCKVLFDEQIAPLQEMVSNSGETDPKVIEAMLRRYYTVVKTATVAQSTFIGSLSNSLIFDHTSFLSKSWQWIYHRFVESSVGQMIADSCSETLTPSSLLPIISENLQKKASEEFIKSLFVEREQDSQDVVHAKFNAALRQLSAQIYDVSMVKAPWYTRWFVQRSCFLGSDATKIEDLIRSVFERMATNKTINISLICQLFDVAINPERQITNVIEREVIL